MRREWGDKTGEYLTRAPLKWFTPAGGTLPPRRPRRPSLFRSVQIKAHYLTGPLQIGLDALRRKRKTMIANADTAIGTGAA